MALSGPADRPSSDRVAGFTRACPFVERPGYPRTLNPGGAARCHAGGAKNSNGSPSGSRKDRPDPYPASLMLPWLTPSWSRRFPNAPARTGPRRRMRRGPGPHGAR